MRTTIPVPARTPAERAALAAWVRLARAQASVERRLAHRLQGSGVSHAQLGVLEALWHLGPLCQRELAAKLLSRPPTLTALLNRLERDGLVRRETDPADRRRRRIVLTAEGERTIARIFPAHAREVAAAFAVLSPDERETLARLSRKLGLAQAAAAPHATRNRRDS
jgi:MarR family 2-MHQ and catechol resistance regulon transcriptional repressor